MKPWKQIIKTTLICVAVLLVVLLLYFFLTPRGSVSWQLLRYDPVYAMTFHAEKTIGLGPDEGRTVFLLQDPIRHEISGGYLDRWTVHRYGPICWAVFGYA